MYLLALLVFMNEKQCYIVLSEFLDQIEKQYCLEKGSYRITFYVISELIICFSVIAHDKKKIKVGSNILISFISEGNIAVSYGFKYRDFISSYLDKNLKEFDQLSSFERAQFITETLNEIYMDQAVIPTQLL